MTELREVAPESKMLVCTEADAGRVAAMLDCGPSAFVHGTALPVGWHFFLLAGETTRSSLRPDGFPCLDLPDIGLPRLMLGGREVQYLDAIPIGFRVRRESSLASLARKESISGPMAVDTIRHQLQPLEAIAPAVVETQIYILLSDGPFRPTQTDVFQTVRADISKVLIPDEIMLFQYSALGFNSHRIHIDRNYARDVEGYPDPVVNGGLTTILLTDLLRNEVGVVPKAIKVRHLVPLFCGQSITLAVNRDGGGWCLAAHDYRGAKAVELKVSIQ
jgi:3-methylfumaryl-CoA hydratase